MSSSNPSCAPRWQRWLTRLGVVAIVGLVAVLSFASSSTVNGTASLLAIGVGVVLLISMLASTCDPSDAPAS